MQRGAIKNGSKQGIPSPISQTNTISSRIRFLGKFHSRNLGGVKKVVFGLRAEQMASMRQDHIVALQS